MITIWNEWLTQFIGIQVCSKANSDALIKRVVLLKIESVTMRIYEPLHGFVKF